MNIHTFSDEEKWISSAVAEITKDLPSEEFSLALSGGSTPVPIYQALAQQDLPWENAKIFQVDERFIAPDKPESNTLLILQNFVDYLAEPSGKFYFFPFGDDISWEESAARYDELLQKEQPQFDVCILGIGADGHIASLFPNEPALVETEKLATTAETNQFEVWKRLTLTFPVILQSKKIVVLLRGEEKKAVLEELQHGKKLWQEFPAKKLNEHQKTEILFLDS